MSRSFRYATIGLIWILAIITHWFGVEFFAPGTQLFSLADPGVGTYVDGGWQAGMYRTFAVRIPLIFIAGSLLWGLAKEYEDSLVGGRRY